MSAGADGPWTLEQLIEAEASGTRLKFLPFWGHQPRSDGALGPHVFSQWFEQPFDHGGATYLSAEHLMMAEKARLFDDHETREKILVSASPGAAKALGRKVRGFDEDIWVEERLGIVTEVSIAKFSATREMRNFLVGTGSRVLVEASPQDTIWGIGVDRHSALVEQPARWPGLNLLGFALMRARARLAQTG